MLQSLTLTQNRHSIKMSSSGQLTIMLAAQKLLPVMTLIMCSFRNYQTIIIRSCIWYVQLAIDFENIDQSKSTCRHDLA